MIPRSPSPSSPEEHHAEVGPGGEAAAAGGAVPSGGGGDKFQFELTLEEEEEDEEEVESELGSPQEKESQPGEEGHQDSSFSPDPRSSRYRPPSPHPSRTLNNAAMSVRSPHRTLASPGRERTDRDRELSQEGDGVTCLRMGT